jgi:hydroxymethylpyrimidine pyrophosphatase-like HAD family hydrolase
MGRELGFMLHGPVPENHFFTYWEPPKAHPDFQLRCQRHAAYARRWEPGFSPVASSQFLVVVGAEEAASRHDELRAALDGYSVIRATSPLSPDSAWLEIFPPQVSKSQAAAWLAGRHQLKASEVLAVGNDYNDLDLLSWAGTAYVVGDAPDLLRRSFSSVARHDESGFAEAVTRWLAKKT